MCNPALIATLVFLPLLLAGCSENTYYVDREVTKIYSVSQKCVISYFKSSEKLRVAVQDQEKSLATLRPISGSGYIWRDGVSYRLLFNDDDVSIDGSKEYLNSEGANHYVGFHFKIDNPKTKESNHIYPLPPGRYNISIQFNGVGSITSICGEFEIRKGTKLFPKIP